MWTSTKLCGTLIWTHYSGWYCLFCCEHAISLAGFYIVVSWLIHKATQVDIWWAIWEEQLKIKVDPIWVFTMHEHAYSFFFIRVCSVRISRIIIFWELTRGWDFEKNKRQKQPKSSKNRLLQVDSKITCYITKKLNTEYRIFIRYNLRIFKSIFSP